MQHVRIQETMAACWLAAACLVAVLPVPLAAQEPAVNPLAGTSHEFEFGSVEPTDGSCSSLCHDYLDPGLAQELTDVIGAWSTSLEANSSGIVAAMCGSCHHSAGGYAAVMADAFSDANAYDAKSHGRLMTLSSPPPGTDASVSGLPRIEDGYFHCSTCHDPHGDTHRPFLRENRRALCVRCHTARGFVDGAAVGGAAAQWGNWNPATFGKEANPGSHPAGEDVTGTRPDGPSVVIPAFFGVAVSPTPDLWSVGPHRSTGASGGVFCLTCHAVHGRAMDSGISGAGSPSSPNTGYLAIPQRCLDLPGYSRSLPNGNAGLNALCEACHGVVGDPALRPDGSPWDGTRTNAHPGRPGDYSHPLDGYPSARILPLSVPPCVWPYGADEGAAGGSFLICETCHVPHPLAAAQGGRPDVLEPNGGYLLRLPVRGDDDEARLCDMCHNAPIQGHHPVGRRYDPTGAASLTSVPAGTQAVLRCSTCHNTAHNWKAPGFVGMDPGWAPSDNGRSADQAADMFNPDTSKTCMDCHYFMDGDGASVSPTMGTRQTVILSGSPEAQHFQERDFSMGTHYIGRIHDDEADRWSNEPLLDMYNAGQTWSMQAPDSGAETVMANGWSRFGGDDAEGKRVLVCESCHELEPDRNRNNPHLLLAPYLEGRVGLGEYGGDEDGRDLLCLLCHGVLNGSHPMTGDPVSSRIGQRDSALDAHSPAVRETILGYAVLIREEGLDAMSCDSCHQPHDANPASFTYMLDSPQDMNGVEPIGYKTEDFRPGYGTLNEEPLVYLEADGSPRTYSTPKVTVCNHLGLCRQCHSK